MYHDLSAVWNITNLSGEIGMEKDQLAGRHRPERRYLARIQTERGGGLKELPWLHSVVESYIEEACDVCFYTTKEILKTFSQGINLTGLGLQLENLSIAKQELISQLVLGKRNIGRLHCWVESAKGIWATPCAAQRVPFGFRADSADVKCSFVNNKSVHVAQHIHKVTRQIRQKLNIVDTVASPRYS